MNRAYVSTCQSGEEGVKQRGLTAWHLPPFYLQVQTSVRHLSWQQEAAVFRGNFLFLSAGALWCGSGMALMAFFAEEWDEVSVETGNLGALGGGWVFNDHQKKTLLFLVSGKQPLFSSVFLRKKQESRGWGLVFTNQIPKCLASRGINLCFLCGFHCSLNCLSLLAWKTH